MRDNSRAKTRQALDDMAMVYCPQHGRYHGLCNSKEATVDSTSDERTINNVMRHEYRVLSEQEKRDMKIIKDMGAGLHRAIESLGPSREISLAKTKLEEAIMWAVKGITG